MGCLRRDENVDFEYFEQLNYDESAVYDVMNYYDVKMWNQWKDEKNTQERRETS